MSVEYILINKSKKQQIAFYHLPVGKAKEISGNPVSAAIVTWYLLKNSGDEIRFISYDDSAFKDTFEYLDVTDSIIKELINDGLLADDGIERFDEEDPEVFIRNLRNVWLEGKNYIP